MHARAHVHMHTRTHTCTHAHTHTHRYTGEHTRANTVTVTHTVTEAQKHTLTPTRSKACAPPHADIMTISLTSADEDQRVGALIVCTSGKNPYECEGNRMRTCCVPTHTHARPYSLTRTHSLSRTDHSMNSVGDAIRHRGQTLFTQTLLGAGGSGWRKGQVADAEGDVRKVLITQIVTPCPWSQASSPRCHVSHSPCLVFAACLLATCLLATCLLGIPLLASRRSMSCCAIRAHGTAGRRCRASLPIAHHSQ